MSAFRFWLRMGAALVLSRFIRSPFGWEYRQGRTWWHRLVNYLVDVSAANRWAGFDIGPPPVVCRQSVPPENPDNHDRNAM